MVRQVVARVGHQRPAAFRAGSVRAVRTLAIVSMLVWAACSGSKQGARPAVDRPRNAQVARASAAGSPPTPAPAPAPAPLPAPSPAPTAAPATAGDDFA